MINFYVINLTGIYEVTTIFLALHLTLGKHWGMEQKKLMSYESYKVVLPTN